MPRRVGLFIPCYVDQLYPDVGLATVDLLERLGVEVVYPPEQTCCGQPMANTGCTAAAAPLARRYVEIFSECEAVVSPSGSCVSMVRNHYEEFFAPDDARSREVRARTYELSEFLVDVLGVDKIPGRFPHRVGIHQSCHGLRELRLGPASERMDGAAAPVNRLRRLLGGLEGIQL